MVHKLRSCLTNARHNRLRQSHNIVLEHKSQKATEPSKSPDLADYFRLPYPEFSSFPLLFFSQFAGTHKNSSPQSSSPNKLQNPQT